MARIVDVEDVIGVLIAGEWYAVEEGSFEVASVMTFRQDQNPKGVSLVDRGSFAFMSQTLGQIQGPLSSILAYRTIVAD